MKLAVNETTVSTPGPTGQRRPDRIEYIGLVGFFGVGLFLLTRLWGAPNGGAFAVAAMILAGYVASDLFSGLVHWAFDTWGSPETPFLGPAFITHFRVHHDDPQDITRHGFVATNGNNCLVTMPVLIMGCLLPSGWSGTAPLQIFLLSLCLGVFATNQCHKWAHEDHVSPLVARLQRWHLILPADHHDVHHHHPYLGHYCITSGWLNAGLDRIRFFRRLEHVITALTGAQPRSNDLAGPSLK